MIHLVLVSTRPQLASRLEEAVGPAFLHCAPERTPASLTELDVLLGGVQRPDILIIDAADPEPALSLSGDVTDQTSTQVILVSTAPEAVAFRALRAGVRDVLPANVTASELRVALDRTAALVLRSSPGSSEETAAAAARPQGRVVTVTSPKGGVGKSTVATNLAVGLAQRFPNQVVIVDGDVHFGDVASALNLEPERSLPDIARGPAAGDSIAVKSYLTRHVTGLFVVPGSDNPTAADTVTAADIGSLIDLLRGQFAWVVIDTAPGLPEHTLAALDLTDHLVLVTSLDVPGVRGLRKEIDTLSDLRMVVGSRHIVVNFNEASRGLSIADVEATIRARVDIVLPQSNAVPLSTNQGIPLLQSNGRDPVTRGLRSLVDLLAPQALTSGRGRHAGTPAR